MGKKVKKKGRSGHNEKRVVTTSRSTIPQQIIPSSEIVDGISVAKVKKMCSHLDQGVDLAKVFHKIESSEAIRCEDCKEGVADRRVRKGRGKHGKKRGVESKAIWVCLECGHFSCGGIGLPTSPQSHSVRHAKQTRHPLAIQFENPNLRWCFPCSTLIPLDKSEENGDSRDVLCDIVKMIKERSSDGAKLAVEEVWFGSGSLTSQTKSRNNVSSNVDGGGVYVVRGLVNLGNTCFFNSIMQNLLAMSKLRDYFLKLDGSLGPLTSALKNLYDESSPETGMRSVINPRSLFGCVCAKAPQFIGYLQHDSHELLRCLLDGLCIEESSARKQINASPEDGVSTNVGPTYVDAIFGGGLSSTVSCLECGHSSTVYEPFLDLSLPIPTKKSLSKKAQPISRAKKSKVPQKRSGRIRSKANRNTDRIAAQSAPNPPTSGDASCQEQSNLPLEGKTEASLGESTLTQLNGSKDEVASSFDLAWLDYLEPDSMLNDEDGPSHMNVVSVIQDSGTVNSIQNQVSSCNNLASSSDFTWLDYVEPDSMLNGHNGASQRNNVSVILDSRTVNSIQNQDSSCNNWEFSCHDCSLYPEKTDDLSGDLTWLDYVEPGIISDNHYTTSQGNLERSRWACSFYPQKSAHLTNDLTWLVYVESGTISDNHDITSHVNDELDIQNSGNNDGTQQNAFLQKDAESSSGITSSYIKSNQKVDYSGNSWEDELPLQLQSSEILLLPYKEETSIDGEIVREGEISSAAAGYDHEQDSIEFNGFGDLFNESEESVAPKNDDNVHANEVADTGFTVGNSSESDPGEVDNTDAPASIDSCLTYFTKPELLSDEHGWHCENCSKALRVQRMKSRKRQQKPMLNIRRNGYDSIHSAPSSSENDYPSPTEVRNLMNLEPLEFSESTGTSGSYRTCNQTTSCDQATNSCGANEPSNAGLNTEKVQLGVFEFAGEHESEGSEEEEEMDSESVKVTRDATKRILINRVPPILTIHLKRFSQDYRGRISKLNGHVDFRDTIDLRRYMDPRCTEKEMHKYCLIGVVEHLGTMRGGHYVAYVRGGAKGTTTKNTERENEDFVWYYASDAHVREASFEEVLRCEAYILFYETF